MFLTLVLLYFAVTTGYQIGLIVLGAVVLVDLMTLATINNIAEAWATGTTSDQEFWKEDGE